MFAWILILSLWVALLLLILHDATKEDSRGSAVSIAAKYLKAFIFLAIQKRQSKRFLQLQSQAKQVRASRQVRCRQRRTGGIRNAETRLLSQSSNWRSRKTSRTQRLGGEDFVGVIVRHETPKTHLDPNWAILGVKFGKADRKMANEALATVVERMQRVFLLSDAKRRPP
jgi:hypothetical protein